MNRAKAIQEIQSWTLEDVIAVFSDNDLPECTVALREQQVDGVRLLQLTELELTAWRNFGIQTRTIKIVTLLLRSIRDHPESYILPPPSNTIEVTSTNHSSMAYDDVRISHFPARNSSEENEENNDNEFWGSDFDDEENDDITCEGDGDDDQPEYSNYGDHLEAESPPPPPVLHPKPKPMAKTNSNAGNFTLPTPPKTDVSKIIHKVNIQPSTAPKAKSINNTQRFQSLRIQEQHKPQLSSTPQQHSNGKETSEDEQPSYYESLYDYHDYPSPQTESTPKFPTPLPTPTPIQTPVHVPSTVHPASEPTTYPYEDDGEYEQIYDTDYNAEFRVPLQQFKSSPHGNISAPDSNTNRKLTPPLASKAQMTPRKSSLPTPTGMPPTSILGAEAEESPGPVRRNTGDSETPRRYPPNATAQSPVVNPKKKLHQALAVNPWFHILDRKKAEDAVKRTGGNGCFLVRPSNNVNPFSLTILFEGQVYNISIRQRVDGSYALGLHKRNERKFQTIESIVEAYRKEHLVLYSQGARVGRTKLTTTPTQQNLYS